MTETGETARKVQPEKLVDQSSNVVGSGGAHTEHNLTCGETLGDSPEPNMEDPANTIGFAPGSEPPAIPLVEGTSGMDHQLLSGTDTPELPEEHVEGSSNKDKRKKGGEEDVVEICRVLKKTPVVDSSATKKSFVCSHCGLSFRTKDGLAVHMEQHESGELEGFVDERDKQAAACTLCDQMFTTPDELDEHLVKSHNIKLNVSGLSQSSSTKKGFKCAYCDTLVAGKHELNTHVKKVHFGFKYYSCPMCNKSLRYR